jgi:quercetin dioxygenase-like cupin family protein
MLDVSPVKRAEWSPLPMEGCRNVEGKVLLDEGSVGVALLRFRPDGTIHEHAGDTDCHVVCLDGRGWTSLGDEQAELRAGEKTFWPAGVSHRLWTTDSEMTTLMVHPLGFTP